MKASGEGSTENPKRSPQVIVSFSGYTPPFDPAPLIQRMLDSVPKNYLAGLSSVVLSNVRDISSKRRRTRVTRRKGRMLLSSARGVYHPAHRGNLAWIEIFVDNALRGWETGWWLKIPFIREGRLSDVLFHEIGHHIHYAIRPELREKEDMADVWKVRLDRQYTRQRFRLIGLIGQALWLLFGRYMGRLRMWGVSREFKTGMISRAEYIERWKGDSKDSVGR